ncbi:hypothetical protein BDQ12DRAFT_670992 [Crucibulum laeve]|uniref:Uncharacterized protein n=1 Tax=Crucibulum laeve TaxID=68775 RepID=A0A5C3LJU0_9AGAR|nr:hypothetical protein BDQ12DRAFT_670992 [Crucibulum laeve]
MAHNIKEGTATFVSTGAGATFLVEKIISLLVGNIGGHILRVVVVVWVSLGDTWVGLHTHESLVQTHTLCIYGLEIPCELASGRPPYAFGLGTGIVAVVAMGYFE